MTVLFWLSSLSAPCHLFPGCCSHNQRCLDLSFTMFFLLRLSEQLDSTCVRGRPASLISLRQKRCVFLQPTLCCSRSCIHLKMVALDVQELLFLWTRPVLWRVLVPIIQRIDFTSSVSDVLKVDSQFLHCFKRCVALVAVDVPADLFYPALYALDLAVFPGSTCGVKQETCFDATLGLLLVVVC